MYTFIYKACQTGSRSIKSNEAWQKCLAGASRFYKSLSVKTVHDMDDLGYTGIYARASEFVYLYVHEWMCVCVCVCINSFCVCVWGVCVCVCLGISEFLCVHVCL